jgi:hypothetical protein
MSSPLAIPDTTIAPTMSQVSKSAAGLSNSPAITSAPPTSSTTPIATTNSSGAGSP